MRREPLYWKEGERWAFRVSLGKDPVTGRRQQPQRQGFRTKREAQQAAEDLIREYDRNVGRAPASDRLSEYLDRWLTTQETSLRQSTLHSYRMAVDRISSRIGAVKMSDLRPLAIEHFYSELLRSGLAPKTVSNTHTVLRKALSDAERLELIPRNPAASARPPAVPHRESEVWTADQVRQFIEHLEGDRLQGLFVLLCLTGLRRGEAIGLRHRDVDLQRGTISVVTSITVVDGATVISSPKTKRSRRQVPLDPVTVGFLEEYIGRQRVDRRAAGDVWTAEVDWLFTDEFGHHLHPDFVSRRFRRLVDESGLPKIRLHDLRHTYGTMSLEAGIHPKVVSERLGHATVGITLDVYSHVSEGMSRDAARVVAERVFPP